MYRFWSRVSSLVITPHLDDVSGKHIESCKPFLTPDAVPVNARNVDMQITTLQKGGCVSGKFRRRCVSRLFNTTPTLLLVYVCYID